MDNSKEALRKWVDETLAEAVAKPESRVGLLDVVFLQGHAYGMIEDGSLRGDISEVWKSYGNYTYVDIPDMYL